LVEETSPLLHIWVDADACPVKREIYRVAERLGLEVTLVANSWMETPVRPWLRLEIVADGFDAADDFIAESIEAGDVVVTSDIPLAARCIEKGAQAIGPKGRVYDQDDIKEALATRDLLADLRDAGEITGGPAPMRPKDRSRFLQALDLLLGRIRREAGR
jgi:uncharacterized protein